MDQQTYEHLPMSHGQRGRSLQIRMARAAFRLGVRELGKLAGVAPMTITRLESGRGAYVSTMQKIQRALEKAGAIFIDGEEPGVRLKKSPRR